MNAIYTLNEIKNKLSDIFTEYNVKKAMVFGSYARGDADNSSDLDIVVDSDKRLLNLSLFGLGSSIEDTLGISVDIFEINEIVNEGALDNAIKNEGVVIYGI